MSSLKNQPEQANCKCCGHTALLYDVCDLNKSCEEANGKYLPLAGIPVYYYRCAHCGFIFTSHFDGFSSKDFKDVIYNAQYPEVDPDYISVRPESNARLIAKLFSSHKDKLKILDYGGGNGSLETNLKINGFRKVKTYDPFNKSFFRKPYKSHSLITAFEVIEHVPDPYETFRDMLSYLDKENGLLMFSTLLQPDDIDMLKAKWWYIAPRNGHISIHTRKSISLLLEKFGFNLVSFNNNLHFTYNNIPAFAEQLIRNAKKTEVKTGGTNSGKPAQQDPDSYYKNALINVVKNYQQGNLDTAESLCHNIIRSLPDTADIYNTLGVILRANKKVEEAVTAYRQALRIAPANASAHSNLANALCDLGKTDEAIVAGREAVGLQPDKAVYHNNLARVYLCASEFQSAVTSSRHAIKLDPKSAEAHRNLGKALLSCGELQEAGAGLETAVKLQPDNVEGMINLGGVYEAMGKLDEAVLWFRKANETAPRLPLPLLNLGLVLKQKGDLEGAKQKFLAALEIDAEHPAAHVGLAFIYFLKGDFAGALPHYEYRRKLENFPWHDVDAPEWQGGPLDGKTLLIRGEQGFGDAIQFIRYARRVRQSGARIVAGCSRELARLFRMSDQIDQVITEGDPMPRIDTWVPVLGLMRAMQTTLETIPAEIPYLRADPAELPAWRDRIGEGPELKVGLVWAGQPKHVNDRNRSIPLKAFHPLFELSETRFFSLQMGPRAAELNDLKEKDRLTDLTGFISDFADSAAAIECLDLIITVDTSVAHLAGALGRPVWTLLPFSPDWRWMLQRDDSPWYPTMRLFRQPRPQDWDTVITTVRDVLCTGWQD